MTWETYTPASTRPIQPGEASLSKKGVLTLLNDDLEAGHILGNKVAVQMDRAAGRIMLQEPRHKDDPTLAVCMAGSKSTRSSKIGLARVLQCMGVEVESAARCQVFARPEGGLIVSIPSDHPAPTKPRATPIRKEADRG